MGKLRGHDITALTFWRKSLEYWCPWKGSFDCILTTVGRGRTLYGTVNLGVAKAWDLYANEMLRCYRAVVSDGLISRDWLTLLVRIETYLDISWIECILIW